VRPRSAATGSRRRIPALLLALVSTAGCYTYQTTGVAPEPGEEAKALLTPEAAIRRSEAIGETVREVEGEVLESDASGLRLVVVRDQLRDELRGNILFVDTLLVPNRDIQSIEVKKLSPVRTGLLGAGIAAAVVLVLTQTLDAGGGGGDGNGGVPNPMTIPLFRILPGR
jgi:hypothetical protein